MRMTGLRGLTGGEGMGERAAMRKDWALIALVICLCFLLSSTGYLSWLYHAMSLPLPVSVEFLTMVCGYLMQAAGLALYLFVLRKPTQDNTWQLLLFALTAHLLVLAPATLSTSSSLVLVCGCLANVFYGLIQGYYLELLCTHVGAEHRGTAFGCGYGASTLLTWLLSLPVGGALARGVPCLACCLAMSIGVVVLTRPAKATSDNEERAPELDAQPQSPDRVTLSLVCAAIVLGSLVKTAGFAFPAADLGNGVNLEFSRLLYGMGLVAAGLASDRDRRFGLVLCGLSLVMPFLMLALSGAGTSGIPLWVLGYLLTGIYVLFGVLLTVDLAAEAGLPYLAGSGMLLRHVGDALGTSLHLVLADKPVALIVVTAVLFVATAMVFLQLYLHMFAPKPEPEPVSSEQQERTQFERFAAAHGLSARERDVLRLVLAEKTNAEIAGELFVSERTVKFHMTNLLKKTGCKTRLEILSCYAEETA